MKKKQDNLLITVNDGVPSFAPRIVNQAEPHPELKAWAIVELFGHQRIVGKVTVDPIDFPGMVRVDVPDLLKNGIVEGAGFTRYFGRSAIYAVTPISEDSVRELLPHVNGYPARPLSIGSAEW